MKTERAYLNDPFTLEFDADVTGKTTLADGRLGILLSQTYFHPTGGGQEHDTGSLEDARVIDVLVDENEDVIQIVDREIRATRVHGKIDRDRRFAFMQHHSGQHLLSAAFHDSAGLETASAHISIESPSTIDLAAARVENADVLRAENLANSVVFEDRPIKSYSVAEDQIHMVPLRRPPKVKGEIRVVEIDSFDYSACGGTHCTRTGMIGIVKVLETERRADKTRVYFVVGQRALERFREEHAIVTRAARALDTAPASIVGKVERQVEALRAAQETLKESEGDRLEREAKRILGAATEFESVRLIALVFPNRSAQELRRIASILQNEPHVVALLASHDGSKFTLVVACAADSGVDANALIRLQLAEIGGRGGGDSNLAQGGGSAQEAYAAVCFTRTRDYVHKLLAEHK